jgi:phytoene dehydrogenase-like protein
MARDWLKGVKPSYDIIIVGSGLGGLTAANRLAKIGHSVLILEHHYNLGGLATWFKRKGGHILDISLHGFPTGMKKTCRKYWSKEIADSIVRLKGIRFDNPQFTFDTSFDKSDFKRLLIEQFKVKEEVFDDFFNTVRDMNFYDDLGMTTRELFQKFFPDRNDIHRLLMEPITYANGSTLDDPAITYGIVFSNFMDKGVYTFQGGTDLLIKKMKEELLKNGVDIFTRCLVDKILVEDGTVQGVQVNGKDINCKAILSNSNLLATINKLVGVDKFSNEFIDEVKKVRLNNSSCQVYIGIRKGEKIDYIADLLFTSTEPKFESQLLLQHMGKSRTFSFYYPHIRPGSEKYSIVSSTNARWEDWADLSDEEYEKEKQTLIDITLDHLEKYVPDIREKADYLEAATPRTFKRYTLHPTGSSFGTKFEGLKVSQDLPKQIKGLFHAGSVGIIMSGWLGAANYGVIVSNEVDKYMYATKSKAPLKTASA